MVQHQRIKVVNELESAAGWSVDNHFTAIQSSPNGYSGNCIELSYKRAIIANRNPFHNQYPWEYSAGWHAAGSTYGIQLVNCDATKAFEGFFVMTWATCDQGDGNAADNTFTITGAGGSITIACRRESWAESWIDFRSKYYATLYVNGGIVGQWSAEWSGLYGPIGHSYPYAPSKGHRVTVSGGSVTWEFLDGLGGVVDSLSSGQSLTTLTYAQYIVGNTGYDPLPNAQDNCYWYYLDEGANEYSDATIVFPDPCGCLVGSRALYIYRKGTTPIAGRESESNVFHIYVGVNAPMEYDWSSSKDYASDWSRTGLVITGWTDIQKRAGLKYLTIRKNNSSISTLYANVECKLYIDYIHGEFSYYGGHEWADGQIFSM